MKSKIKCFIFICVLMSLGSFLIETPVSAAEGQQQTQLTIISVAAHKPNTTAIPLSANTAHRIDEALNGYRWTVDGTNYQFQTTYTNTEDIANGNLSNYDVLMMCGFQAETIWCTQPPFKPRGFKIYDKNNHIMRNLENEEVTGVMIKDEIRKFIEEEGKGYVGHCNGASFLLKKLETPETVKEYIQHYNHVIDADIYLDWHSGEPLVSEYMFLERFPIWKRMPNLPGYLEPDPTMMYGAGYNWYSGTDPDNTSQLGGVPLDLVIRDKEHPLLSDYLNDTWRVMSVGGTGFSIKGDGVSILADHPSNAFEDNESTKIDAWHYVGHLPPGFFHRFQDMVIPKVIVFLNETIRDSGDWDPTDRTLITNLSDKPAFIAFQHPDESGGRVILGGPHPECSIWWGGEIKRFNNTDSNTLFKGLTYWVNESNVPMNSSVYIRDYNYWFCRREAAWASKKVPDDYLPPVYGRSQVVDIDPYLQESYEFTIKCCVGKEKDEEWTSENLSLFYRYNGSNSSYTWTNWKRYDSIDAKPYRFTFNALDANGSGRYQFYSRFNTTFNDGSKESYTNESAPPGPDAECVVGGKIYADFTYSPKSPFDIDTITFTDLSITAENTHITSWDWDFGDGSSSQSEESGGATHKYADNGTYVVTLNVTNNLSYWDNISKTVFVRNVCPEADFSPKFKVAWVNETVNFTDNSSDVDGTIASWTWKFGDGSISYEQNASHSYSTSGYYVVSLTATDDDNADNTEKESEKGSVLVIDWLVNASLSGNNTCAMIQDAIDNATTGEFIYINNATYTENLTINKSLFLFGEDKYGVIIQGFVDMANSFDYELPGKDMGFSYISMEGNELLMHFNNDSNVGEDYGTSNVIYDSSGQENNGTRYGATWNTDTLKGAGCFDFDGTDDSINLSSIPALCGENVTVSAWIYWNGGSGNSDPILSQCNANVKGYRLYVKPQTDEPTFRLNNTNAVSSTAISSGWHHIVGTHNGTTLKIYVDGVLQGSAGKTGSGVDTVGYIGFDNISTYFSGRIDEVTVWNRALTDDEISIMYHANFGVYMERITISDSFRAGASPCNHSELSECILINNTMGVLLNNSIDVRIHMCNISDCGTGISIINSTPNTNNGNRLVDCNIYNVTNGVIVNFSSNLDIIRSYVNASSANMTFNNCSFDDIFVYESSSTNNIAPDIPTLSGPSLGDINVSYNYSACTNDSNDDQILYWFDWGDGNNTGWLNLYWSNVSVNASHNWTQQGGYYVRVKAKDVFNNESVWSDSILFKTETLSPLINSVNNTPNVTGSGGIINITTNVTDDISGNWSGIKIVKVNITYPDSTTGNYTMDSVGNDTYEYIFSDAWLVSQYNYTIWATDNAYNTNSSSGHSFNVSANATISIATLKDSYGSNEYINLTDPPENPEYILVESGLTWDKYLNTANSKCRLEVSTGPVNYQDENDIWQPINTTIGNVNVTISGRDYIYGMEEADYHVFYMEKSSQVKTRPIAFLRESYGVTLSPWDSLKFDDGTNVHGKTQSIAEVENNMITYQNQYGDGIHLRYICRNTGVKSELILDSFDLLSTPDADANLVFKETVRAYEFDGFTENRSMGIFYGKDRLSFKDFNDWDDNEIVTNEEIWFNDESNNTVFFIPRLFAYDSNHSHEVLLLNKSLHMTRFGNLRVEIHIPYNWLSDANTTYPVYIDPSLIFYCDDSDGYIYKKSTSYSTARNSLKGTVNDDGTAIYIGQRYQPGIPDNYYYVYRGFLFFDTSPIPNVANITNANLTIYKYLDNSNKDFSITIQNGQPDSPHKPLLAEDYYYGNYSGDGGSLHTSDFGSGANIISFNESGRSWINKSDITKLCLRSSRDINNQAPSTGPWTNQEYVGIYSGDSSSSKPKLSVEYILNQSKINNTGSTNISGYLLIQVQYEDLAAPEGEEWVVDNDTVNETTPRTINISEQLALDTIFNGLVNTNDLTNGDGTYRVYAAFRDEDGNILQCDDDTYLVATWEFTVTFS